MGDESNSDIDPYLNDSMDSYGFPTNFDLYPKDESDSSLVQGVKFGNIDYVKWILDGLPDSGPERVSTLNGARKWTEVQKKWGYDNDWTWFGDTALIAAARLGNLEMVRLLLLAKADPFLESCPSGDKYETALKAAETVKKYVEQQVDELDRGSLCVYGSDVHTDAGKHVESLLTKLYTYEKIIDLLKLVEGFWDKSPYSSASHSKKRSKAFSDSPNQPKDTEGLIRSIEDFDFIHQDICKEKLTDLSRKFSAIQEQKRAELVPQYQSAVKFPSYAQGGKTGQVPKKKHVEVPKSKAPSGPRCRGDNCSNSPAQNCPQNSCRMCCTATGECSRHWKNYKRPATGPRPSAKRNKCYANFLNTLFTNV